MSSRETRSCLLRFLGVLLLGVAGLVLLVSAVIFVGPPHMPREERVEVKRKAASLPNSVDLSVIDTLISAHSKWEKTGGKYPDGEEIPRLVYRKDINGDGELDEVAIAGGIDIEIRVSGRQTRFIRGLGESSSGATSAGFDDVDSDGFSDTWCCDPADNEIRVFYGDAVGGLLAEQRIDAIDQYEFEGAFFDVNGDRVPDIVLRLHDHADLGRTQPTGEYSWIELERKR